MKRLLDILEMIATFVAVILFVMWMFYKQEVNPPLHITNDKSLRERLFEQE